MQHDLIIHKTSRRQAFRWSS